MAFGFCLYTCSIVASCHKFLYLSIYFYHEDYFNFSYIYVIFEQQVVIIASKICIKFVSGFLEFEFLEHYKFFFVSKHLRCFRVMKMRISLSCSTNKTVDDFSLICDCRSNKKTQIIELFNDLLIGSFRKLLIANLASSFPNKHP